MSHLKDKIKEAVFHIAFEWKKKGKTSIRVKSIDETIDDLIRSDKSLVRFGDGEIKIIEKVSIGTQEYDNQLAERLSQLIQSDREQVLIGIPGIFDDMDLYISFFHGKHIKDIADPIRCMKMLSFQDRIIYMKIRVCQISGSER